MYIKVKYLADAVIQSDLQSTGSDQESNPGDANHCATSQMPCAQGHMAPQQSMMYSIMVANQHGSAPLQNPNKADHTDSA